MRGILAKKILLIILSIFIFIGCSRKSEQLQKSAPNDPSKDLFISGLMYSPDGKSIAVINGETVRERDAVGNFTIKNIAQDFVVVVKDNKEYIIKPPSARSNQISENRMDQYLETTHGTQQSLNISQESVVYSQLISKKEEQLLEDKKREYLSLARSFEQQSNSLRDSQRAFYYLNEALNNYKYALSLEKNSAEKSDIELKIERLEDRIRAINNSLNERSNDGQRSYYRY
ncbi:MAG: hypothetical protein V1840_06015 [Candidatus Omnitrophota bacterium]